MAFPKFVEFHEEGPREGFQSEKVQFPLAQRVALVDALSDTGLAKIQVASFVNPKMVPTMADSAQLFGAIRKRDGVRHTALWLNRRGFEQAARTPGVDLDGKVIFYASEGLSQSNNGCSMLNQRQRLLEWLDVFEEHGLPLENLYITAAFGCQIDGAVPLEAVLQVVDLVAQACAERAARLPGIVLGDTVGWANPEEVKRRVQAVRARAPGVRVGLHLHDTRGMGPANFYAALQEGVDLFDASVAGLGGCPFSNHANMQAAGNICTEDMVQMCHEMGIATGIDLEKLLEASSLAEEIIGRPLAGHTMHSGSIASRRDALAIAH